MSRPIHFEIHAGDPERAIAFYTAVFGWSFTKWDGPWPYWLVGTGEGPGVNGGLVPRRGDAPVDGAAVNAWVMTVDVKSVDDALALAVAQGGTVAVEKMEIQGIGFLAYLKDTEGNIFGIMENTPPA